MTTDGRAVVLATVDGSIEAADGVLVASQLARAWGAELHVVHVWSGMTSPLIRAAAEGAARRLLADEVAGAVRKGAAVSDPALPDRLGGARNCVVGGRA